MGNRGLEKVGINKLDKRTFNGFKKGVFGFITVHHGYDDMTFIVLPRASFGIRGESKHILNALDDTLGYKLDSAIREQLNLDKTFIIEESLSSGKIILGSKNYKLADDVVKNLLNQPLKKTSIKLESKELDILHASNNDDHLVIVTAEKVTSTGISVLKDNITVKENELHQLKNIMKKTVEEKVEEIVRYHQNLVGLAELKVKKGEVKVMENPDFFPEISEILLRYEYRKKGGKGQIVPIETKSPDYKMFIMDDKIVTMLPRKLVITEKESNFNLDKAILSLKSDIHKSFGYMDSFDEPFDGILFERLQQDGKKKSTVPWWKKSMFKLSNDFEIELSISDWGVQVKREVINDLLINYIQQSVTQKENNDDVYSDILNWG